jgi:hypothetical protein
MSKLNFYKESLSFLQCDQRSYSNSKSPVFFPLLVMDHAWSQRPGNSFPVYPYIAPVWVYQPVIFHLSVRGGYYLPGNE